MFDWRRYVDLAAELGERQGDEAAQRSAISRAYYAAYGVAAQHLIDQGILVSGSINHRSVWQAFGDQSDRDRWSIRNWGFVLKDAREMADYRALPPSDLGKKVDEALKLSRRLIATLERLTVKPPE